MLGLGWNGMGKQVFIIVLLITYYFVCKMQLGYTIYIHSLEEKERELQLEKEKGGDSLPIAINLGKARRSRAEPKPASSSLLIRICTALLYLRSCTPFLENLIPPTLRLLELGWNNKQDIHT